jgi:hypothetical protein
MFEVRCLSERRHAASLSVLLTLALVIAQTGAVLHGYSHLRAPSEPARSGQSCGDCLSFSPLLTAAGGTVHLHLFARMHAGMRYLPPVAPLVGQASQHAFFARAPPLLG